jgi:hypothetical protein
MPQLVEYPLEEGGTVLVQLHDVPSVGVTRGLGQRAEDITQRSTRTFEDATRSVTPAAYSLISRLQQLARPPQEIRLEFGIQLTAETGAFIASVGAEANFKVSLTWRSDQAGGAGESRSGGS